MPPNSGQQHHQRHQTRSCYDAVTCTLGLALVLLLHLGLAATAAVVAAAASTLTALPESIKHLDTSAAAATQPTAAASKVSPSSTIFIGGSSRNGLAGFSTLDKEVVERIIKQWAPVVWLAPEEKFMPLGVDEFLNHVHPMDKGNTFIPGMPVGDNSKKAYLVTNAEVEELLDNESSFLYGRNPNEFPVPIYAVVTLCNRTVLPASNGAKLVGVGTTAATIQPSSNQQPTLTNTRGPYIPVSIDPREVRNDTIRRSSRLYPVFKRMRRHVPPQDPLNIAPPKPLALDYDLVMGESAVDSGADLVASASGTTSIPASSDGNKGAKVNNFIANLADNVKFSVQDELDNNINFENNANEPKQPTADQQVPLFHVTYWMFYPYSQGKTMCTLNLGPLGSIPFPAVYGFCLGRRKDIGSHIGDWEHMSLYFNGAAEPDAMYVSAHDAGAYYSYSHLTGSFEFKRQETRKGLLQRPNFPKTVTTYNNHPVLFAAKGSHGLWTAPGKHRFVKVARLYDINGFGTPWNTWKTVDITYENLKSYGRSLVPTWLSFKGKWGNPKSKCHPFRRIGLNFCEYTDGPTGIPLKEPHFQCGATYR